ncbi:MAG: PfkB family carbohydrate kinase [Pseudomonadota bacterium]
MNRLELDIPQDKEFDVVGMGLNAVDYLCVVPHFPTYDSKTKMLDFMRQGGGQVATALVTCSRLGLKTKYIGKIGSDELGVFSKESIEKEGVDASDIIVEEGSRTQFAFILVDNSTGERTIIWDRDPKLEIRPQELDRSATCSGRVLHLDGHEVPASIQAAKWAREAGIPVVLDAETVKDGTEELLFLTDILIASTTFPRILTGISDVIQALNKLKAYGSNVVCITLGKEGALAYYRGQIIKCPGFEVKALDSTGAGDVFHGAFIYGMLERWTIEETLRFANAAAAMKCRSIGGRQGIPTQVEVEEFLERNVEG